MKRSLVAAVSAAMLAGSLSACIPTEGPAATETVTEATGSDGLSDAEVEEAYVEVIRTQIPNISDSDQDLVDMGEAVCDNFDAGGDLYGTANAITQGGFSDYDAGFIVGASVPAFCPEHTSKIENP